MLSLGTAATAVAAVAIVPSRRSPGTKTSNGVAKPRGKPTLTPEDYAAAMVTSTDEDPQQMPQQQPPQQPPQQPQPVKRKRGRPPKDPSQLLTPRKKK